MKFTLPWLREHLETEASLDEILTALTGLGLEVEAVTERGSDLSSFRIAEVVGARRHPNAERLNLCEVDAGDGAPVEVVCGAPNVHLGMKAVFAPLGTTIPESGIVLERAQIRGITSNGMLCSARELKLGEDHSGIIELAADAPVGRPASDVLAFEGPVIEVGLTPDRSDCFGVVGIARDLAAAGLGRLKTRDLTPVDPAFASDLRITLDFPEEVSEACPLFVGRVFRGVRNRPSPPWLQERLTAIGLRPISALVDITNFLTFDLCRPLHVFDAGRVQGDLVIRLARPGESLRALDGKTYALDDGMSVISDDTGPISIGGVMGGEVTGCGETTTEVILEVALFDARRTATTGRKLGIESDARTRFERGLDPGMVLPGTEYASRLILDLCGGEAGDVVIAGAVPPRLPSFPFRTGQVARLAGISLETATIERHLGALGFSVARPETEEVLDVTPPTWRPDVTQEADVVEEVARLHGYDKIPPMPVTRAVAVAQAAVTPEQRMRMAARRILASRGLSEAVTWSFLKPEIARDFGNDGLRLRNPLNAELSVLRPSVLPNLLGAAARNQARGLASVALFEVGPRFQGGLPGEQETTAGGIRAGRLHGRHWLVADREVDIYDARADAMAALAATKLNVEALVVVAGGPDHFHPGRKGQLRLGPKLALAEFGEIHPAIVSRHEVEGPVVGFEVFLDRLPKPKTKVGRTRPPLKASPFPPVERDFAFVVAAETEAESVLAAVRGADKALIREVGLFDVYSGQGLEDGQKSLAVAVRMQAQDRTLTEDEIEAVGKKIIAAAAKTTGAVLRS